MWIITYHDYDNIKLRVKTYRSDYKGSILGAIGDFYSRFNYMSIIKIEWE